MMITIMMKMMIIMMMMWRGSKVEGGSNEVKGKNENEIKYAEGGMRWREEKLKWRKVES